MHRKRKTDENQDSAIIFSLFSVFIFFISFFYYILNNKENIIEERINRIKMAIMIFINNNKAELIIIFLILVFILIGSGLFLEKEKKKNSDNNKNKEKEYKNDYNSRNNKEEEARSETKYSNKNRNEDETLKNGKEKDQKYKISFFEENPNTIISIIEITYKKWKEAKDLNLPRYYFFQNLFKDYEEELNLENKKVLKLIWHELSKISHPDSISTFDKGGKLELFKKLNEIYSSYKKNL